MSEIEFCDNLKYLIEVSACVGLAAVMLTSRLRAGAGLAVLRQLCVRSLLALRTVPISFASCFISCDLSLSAWQGFVNPLLASMVSHKGTLNKREITKLAGSSPLPGMGL